MFKTSTPWSNLLSTESKYNISVNPLQLKSSIFALLLLAVTPFILSSFYFFHWITASFVFAAGVYLLILFAVEQRSGVLERNCFLLAQGFAFTLNDKGSCVFDLDITLDNRRCSEEASILYQGLLLPCSRISFIGCWLTIAFKKPSNHKVKTYNKYTDNEKTHIKHYFIARGRLSEQDFSRLSRTILYVSSNPEVM